MDKVKLLWVGDAVAKTGFGRVTHSVLDRICNRFSVSVLGINYFGDPHEYTYPIYPALHCNNNDFVGVTRLVPLIRNIKPDVVLMMADHWIVRRYLKEIEKNKDTIDDCKLIGYIPVDSKNVAYAERLDALDCCVFYTDFGLQESRRCGFTGRGEIIPHGIDSDLFFPMNKEEARKRFSSKLSEDSFIFGDVNRNQFRKRQDIVIESFKLFLDETKDEDAFLYLHCSVNDYIGYDIDQLVKYYGISNKVLIPEKGFGLHNNFDDNTMCVIYNSLDVHVSSAMGEGWGLTHLESMACGIPNIGVNWSGLSSWVKDTVLLVEPSVTVTYPGTNTIGGVVSAQDFASAMVKMYKDKDLREDYARKGFELAHCDDFKWGTIADKFANLIEDVVNV